MTRRQSTAVLVLGTTQTLAWGSTYYLPAILANPIAEDLGIAASGVFAAFSASLLLTALVGPFAGRRIDRFGGRDVLAASNVIFAAGLGLLGLADGAMLMWLGWIVIGLGMALGLYEAAFSTLTGLYGVDARRGITGITLIAGFASTVCWPISAWMEAAYGWRVACFTWAAAHLLLGLPLHRLLIPAASNPAAAQSPQSAGKAASRRNMTLLAFVFAVTWFISTAMAAHLPRLLGEAGLTPAAAIFAAALVGPAQVAGRLLDFSLMKSLHPLTSARLAALAHPLGALALMAAGGPAATVFALLHGVGNGILTIAKGTLPLVIFGAGDYGYRQGLLMAPARIAQALAPLAFALLLDGFGLLALIGSAALGLLACAALVLLDVHTGRRERVDA